jgi:hypothetical protein
MDCEQAYETTVHLVRGYMGFVLLPVTLLDVKHKGFYILQGSKDSLELSEIFMPLSKVFGERKLITVQYI